MKNIEKQLFKIIRDQYRTDPVGLLYSGGLDSSIIAKIMLQSIPSSSIKVVSVGLAASYDINNATLGAAELGIELHKCFLTIELVQDTIKSLKQMKLFSNPSDLAIAIPLFLGMKTLVNKFDVKNIFLGQGADELFGGYEKYEQLSKQSWVVTKETMMNDLKVLQNDQIIKEQKMSQYFGLDINYPFLDPKIIEYASSYPVTTHIIHTSKGEVIRKALLRKLAEKIGLSVNITSQPKKAIQYGSGTMKILRKIVKAENYNNLPDWFQACFQSAGSISN